MARILDANPQLEVFQEYWDEHSARVDSYQKVGSKVSSLGYRLHKGEVH